MQPDITSFELVLYALLCGFSAVFSGIAGAGGGFVVTPFLIFLGASPAQAVASGKLGGLSLSVASMHGLSSVKRQASKRTLIVIVTLSVVIGLLSPAVIVRLDSEVYRRVLGVLILAMIPILIVKKVGQTEFKPSLPRKALGYVLLVISLAMFAVFAGGMGTLVVIVLMAFLGMSALEANITKRYSQIIINIVVVISLLSSGLILWHVAIIGAMSSAVGGYFGGKLAVKKGNKFVMTVFIILMFVSALELLLG